MHVYLPAQRDAPTNMINNALSVASAHKLRFGQDLILYNLELSESDRGFDGAAHKDAWNNDPVWQGVRENVEGSPPSATGRRRSSPPRSCSSRSSASCSAASSSCRWRLRRATSSRRR